MEKMLLDLIKLRQSDRAYDASRSVEPAKIEYILEAARLAPSSGNVQSWKFVVVTDPQQQRQTAAAMTGKNGTNRFVTQAPVHIVLVKENTKLLSMGRRLLDLMHFRDIDMGLVAAHITLAAAEQGLGSCIIGSFDKCQMHHLLGIPFSKSISLVITVGYAAQPVREKKRKPFDQVVSFNRYR
ncbi:MAG: nitroreductase family protein [Bacteroidota bacterium]|nr:nitroreductase family protein [Bacteroidota bacterium]